MINLVAPPCMVVFKRPHSTKRSPLLRRFWPVDTPPNPELLVSAKDRLDLVDRVRRVEARVARITAKGRVCAKS